LHRYSNCGFVGAAGDLPIRPWWYGNTTVSPMNIAPVDTLSELSILFMFYRGAMRFALVQNNAAAGTYGNVIHQAETGFNSADSMSRGVVYISAAEFTARGALSFETPWTLEGPYDFVYGSNNTNFSTYHVFKYSTAASVGVFRSVGDDFGLCGARPAPALTYNYFAPMEIEGFTAERQVKGLQLNPSLSGANQHLLQVQDDTRRSVVPSVGEKPKALPNARDELIETSRLHNAQQGKGPLPSAKH